MAGHIPTATEAFEQRLWAEARRILSDRPLDQLGADDLEHLAVAAYLTGDDDRAVAAWEKAYERHLGEGSHGEGALCAFWAAYCLMMRGQMAHAGGWLRRAETIVEQVDCPAAGYVLIPPLLGALDAGEPDQARELALRAGEIADRFGDRDLAAFSTLGHGQALLASGDEPAGLTLFDEVMLTVTSGEPSPVTTGIVYCAVILGCMEVYDLARAAEWTEALDQWCRSQQELVPYRGQCLVHQSQLQQAAGEWSRAVSTAVSACDHLTDPPHPALGLAYYQEGELHRVRGELAAAVDAYGRASRSGYQPMPGLALVELARGEVVAAAAGIRRALIDANQPFQRPPLLAAAVEILVAHGDLEAAVEAATELGEIARGSSSDMLAAMAEHATGMVLLAEDEPDRALPHLRKAASVWRQLGTPYEAAKTATLLGRTCQALDDHSSARLELDNAREMFAALGATADLASLEDSSGGVGPSRPGGGLSERELEVLACVADGKTNPDIAEELSISRHTVGRHLENIFAKLGVSNRAAATAYAYEHGLL